MKLKSELIDELRQVKDELSRLRNNQIPCDYTMARCPDCGAAVLIYNGAYARRLDKSKTFYCAVGHPFTFNR